MQFTLIDKIIKIEPGVSIKASKRLCADEEYLADHFPGYPVMPGVMMLETLVQAGAWLLRATNTFRDSMIVLKEARNVKYAQFLEPGQTLEIDVKMLKDERPKYTFQGTGSVEGQSILSARFTLRCFNLSEIDERLALNDRIIIKNMRRKFELLHGSVAGV